MSFRKVHSACPDEEVDTMKKYAAKMKDLVAIAEADKENGSGDDDDDGDGDGDDDGGDDGDDK